MNLSLQVSSVLVSLLFGLFFSLELNYIYVRVKFKKKLFKILYNLLFVFINVLMYYLVLEKTNNGILHPYCILTILVGFFLTEYILLKLR